MNNDCEIVKLKIIICHMMTAFNWLINVIPKTCFECEGLFEYITNKITKGKTPFDIPAVMENKNMVNW